MGFIAGYFAHRSGSQAWRLFLTTGIIGGYTTFSSFSLDAALLIERGRPGAALAYLLGSVLLGLTGLFGGLRLARCIVETGRL